MKNDLLEMVAAALLIGVAVLLLVLGTFVVTQSGGGNWIGGAEIGLGMLATGGAAVALYLVGLAVSANLRARGKPACWRLYAGMIPVLLVLTPVTLVAKALLVDFEGWQERRDEAAHKEEAAAEAALVADPVRLQAYVAKHGVDTRFRASKRTPLEVAASQNYRNLIELFLAQGAHVTDPALVSAVNQADVATFDLLLLHTRFIDGKIALARQRRAQGEANGSENDAFPLGQDALEAAFNLGRFDLMKRLAQAGVATNGLAATLIGNKKYLRFFTGEVNWKSLVTRWR